MANHSVLLTTKPGIRSIGIYNDISFLSVLPESNFFRLMSYGSLADNFWCFNQKTPRMGIPRFGDAELVYACGTGMLSGCQAQGCRIGISFSKAIEVTSFYDQGKSNICTNARKHASFFTFS